MWWTIVVWRIVKARSISRQDAGKVRDGRGQGFACCPARVLAIGVDVPDINPYVSGGLAFGHVDDIDLEVQGHADAVFGDVGPDERVWDVEWTFGRFVCEDAVDVAGTEGSGFVKSLALGRAEDLGVVSSHCSDGCRYGQECG